MINSPIALLDDPDDPSLVALHLLNVLAVGRSLFPGEMFCLRERCKKKNEEKKLTSVSFMYVCVAENGELLVYFFFFAPSP